MCHAPGNTHNATDYRRHNCRRVRGSQTCLAALTAIPKAGQRAKQSLSMLGRRCRTMKASALLR